MLAQIPMILINVKSTQFKFMQPKKFNITNFNYISSIRLENRVILLKELSDLLFLFGQYVIAQKLYAFLYDRLQNDPFFVLITASCKVSLFSNPS